MLMAQAVRACSRETPAPRGLMASHLGRYETLSSPWFELHDPPTDSTSDRDRVADDGDTTPPRSTPAPTIHPLHELPVHAARPLPHVLPRALRSPPHRTRPPTVPRARRADRQRLRNRDGTRRTDGRKPSRHRVRRGTARPTVARTCRGNLGLH